MMLCFKSCLAEEMKQFLHLLELANRDTESYLYTLHSLDAFMMKHKILDKSLSEETLTAWLAERNISDKTRNYEISRVNVFGTFLHSFGIDVYKMDHCKEADTYKPYTFSDDEFKRIFVAADNGSASYVKTESQYIFPLVLRILFGTGMRITEVFNLKWEDVDFENGIIFIEIAKNDKQRKIPIAYSLTEIMRAYKCRRLKDYPEDKYMFTNHERTEAPYRYAAFNYWFCKVLRSAGIENSRTKPFERVISTHVIRHNFTFRSFKKALQEDRSLEESMPYLSAYLGHNSLYGTEKYLTTDYTLYTRSHEIVNSSVADVFPEVRFE